MKTRSRQLALLTATVALALTAGPVTAQHSDPADTGGRVYGLVGGAFGDGSFAAIGTGVGLRLTPHLGLDLELSHLAGRSGGDAPAPWLAAVSAFSIFSTTVAEDYPPLGGDDALFPFIHVENRGRDVTTLLTRFTVEFPIADRFLFPYLTGGGGLGRVTERYSIVVDPFPWLPFEDSLSTEPADDAADVESLQGGTFPGPGAFAELGLALVLGGGVDVRLWRGFAVGVDIRWLRVLGSYDALDTAQVTTRASYRF